MEKNNVEERNENRFLDGPYAVWNLGILQILLMVINSIINSL